MKIDPAAATSRVGVRVRFGETDLMGIVHHASYVSYLEVARIEWLRRRGVAYAQWAASGRHLPVVEMSIKYRAPCRFDDELVVRATLGEIRAASVRFDYVVYRGDVLCAEAATRLACIDGEGTLRRITEDMSAVLLRPEG